MKAEEYDRIVSELELKASSDPKGYNIHVAKLVVLGYAYIFGLIAFLLAVVGLLLWLLLIVKVWVLVKFSFLFFIAAWLVAKSLWVKYSDPEGIRLTRDQVPALFDLIAEVRSAANGPEIDQVVLSDEFNCAITQVPRLGIFGWYKNFLILGLPLMQSVSPSQFKSILAHEMGHLSDQHGKFGAWVYHVRAAWHQTYTSLAYESGIGIGLVKRFANWFVPLFDAHTSVLMREHEYAADKISAEIAGAESAANALIQTALKGAFLNEDYWENYRKQVVDLPSPPEGALSNLKMYLQRPIEAHRAEEFLKGRWAKHDSNDTHPAISERVRALVPDKDWSDLRIIATEAAQRFNVERTAAAELFGSAIEWMEKELDAKFQASVETDWSIRHAVATENRRRLIELEGFDEVRALTKDEVLQLVHASSFLEETDVAAERYRKAVEQFPEEADLHFGRGLLLLEQKDEAGVAELETSVELKPMLGPDAFGAVYAFYLRKGDENTAQKYYKKTIAISEEIQEAAVNLDTINKQDKFVEHKLTSNIVSELAVAINDEKRVTEAFVVAKLVPEILGGYQHILCVKVSAFTSDEQALELLQRLSHHENVAGFYLLTWPAVPGNLRSACTTLANSKVYDRKNFQGR